MHVLVVGHQAATAGAAEVARAGDDVAHRESEAGFQREAALVHVAATPAAERCVVARVLPQQCTEVCQQRSGNRDDGPGGVEHEGDDTGREPPGVDLPPARDGTVHPGDRSHHRADHRVHPRTGEPTEQRAGNGRRSSFGP